MNPILSRELRLRWRDIRSYWLLFAITALLCVAATWIYRNVAGTEMGSSLAYPVPFTYSPYYRSAPGSYYPPFASSSGTSMAYSHDHASETGRELFQDMAIGNVIAWLLIAPALTATGIAKEREGGLLESLWLTPFRVGRQIRGRLGATLFFLFVLQLTVLPIYGIALMLGGVSPGEVAIAAVIVAVTAVLSSSLGLWCSARSYRPANSLGGVFIFIGLWTVVAYYMADANGSGPTDAWWIVSALGHPLALMFALVENPAIGSGSGTRSRFTPNDTIILGLSLEVCATIWLLWRTTRFASKPLPEARWQERNATLQRWKTRFEEQKRERQQRQETARMQQHVAGALLWELPVERFIRFADPLLTREVRARFRLRRGSSLVSILRTVSFLIGAGMWVYMGLATTDPMIRGDAAHTLLAGLLIAGILSMAVMSASSFSRERESGTWEGLRLSLLESGHIVRSKWLSPIVTFLYWSAPLWILLPLCVNRGQQSDTGLPLLYLLGAILVLLFSLGATSAWGLWISKWARNTAAATSSTLAILLILLIGLPFVNSILNANNPTAVNLFSPTQTYNGFSYYFDSSDEDMKRLRAQGLSWSYHPYITLNFIAPNRSNHYDWHQQGSTQLLVWICDLGESAAVTTLLLFLLTRRVKCERD